MDWRKILIAYITHILREEGVDYLPREVIGLNREELAALYRAAADSPEVSEAHSAALSAAAAELDGR